VRGAFGYVDGAQLSGSVVDVSEQLSVNLLEVGKIVGRKVEVDLAGCNLGEGTLCFIERFVIGQAETVAENW